MRRSHERRSVWAGLATFVVLFGVWYMLTTLTQAISPGRFPAPSEVGDALRQIALTGYADARLHEHVLHSVKLVLYGFAAATLVGVPLGLAMGWNRSIETFARPPWFSPATFCANASIVSTLIEPPSPVTSPRGPRA